MEWLRLLKFLWIDRSELKFWDEILQSRRRIRVSRIALLIHKFIIGKPRWDPTLKFSMQSVVLI